eukprot:scaffold265081_cov15-Tisochrysis_lutea.AAC.1
MSCLSFSLIDGGEVLALPVSLFVCYAMSLACASIKLPKRTLHATTSCCSGLFPPRHWPAHQQLLLCLQVQVAV